MLSIAIQAGGESKRMGTDKGLIPFLGMPLIERVVERVAPLANEILVTTNRPQDYQFMKSVRLVKDIVPGRGALGGLFTALSEAKFGKVGVVACDMPFINPDLLAALFDSLDSEKADLVVPDTGRGLEPLHAIYLREKCLPHVQYALDTGEWRIDSWFKRVSMYRFPLEEIRKIDPELLSFRNVNTPIELNEALELGLNFENGCG